MSDTQLRYTFEDVSARGYPGTAVCHCENIVQRVLPFLFERFWKEILSEWEYL